MEFAVEATLGHNIQSLTNRQKKLTKRKFDDQTVVTRIKK